MAEEVKTDGLPAMSAEARAARNAYMRAWHKKNPEKSKAIRERYWLKKAATDKSAG